MPCLAHGLGDELLGQVGAFARGDHPADHVAAEDVEDHVEVEVGPLGRPQELGDVPGPDLVGRGGQQFGLGVGRVAELVAPLADLPLAARMRYMVRIEQRYWPSSSSVAYTSAGALSAKRSLFRVSSSACRSWASKARGGRGRAPPRRAARSGVRRRARRCRRAGAPTPQAQGAAGRAGAERRGAVRPRAAIRCSRARRSAVGSPSTRATFFWTSMTSSALSSSARSSRSRVSWAMCSASPRGDVRLGAALLRRQRGQVGRLALAPPGAQVTTSTHPRGASARRSRRAWCSGRRPAECDACRRWRTYGAVHAQHLGIAAGRDRRRADPGASPVALRAPCDAPGSEETFTACIATFACWLIVIPTSLLTDLWGRCRRSYWHGGRRMVEKVHDLPT